MSNTYRKKPIVVEAIQYKGTNENSKDISALAPDVLIQFHHPIIGSHDQPYLVIPTLEGDMIGFINDWIIKGVNGKIYPCKPDIFENTYEYFGGSLDTYK